MRSCVSAEAACPSSRRESMRTDTQGWLGQLHCEPHQSRFGPMFPQNLFLPPHPPNRFVQAFGTMCVREHQTDAVLLHDLLNSISPRFFLQPLVLVNPRLRCREGSPVHRLRAVTPAGPALPVPRGTGKDNLGNKR